MSGRDRSTMSSCLRNNKYEKMRKKAASQQETRGQCNKLKDKRLIESILLHGRTGRFSFSHDTQLFYNFSGFSTTPLLLHDVEFCFETKSYMCGVLNALAWLLTPDFFFVSF